MKKYESPTAEIIEVLVEENLMGDHIDASIGGGTPGGGFTPIN